MIRVLIAGLGNMGLSHALSHHRHDGAEIVGLVNRTGQVRHCDLARYRMFTDFHAALAATRPDLAVIATYSDSHTEYAIAEDTDLTRHMHDAVQSLHICLAADESIRTGQPIAFSGDRE